MTFNKALETVMKLDFTSREMLLEVLEGRQIEERRKEILANGRKAKADFKKGKLRGGNATEIIAELHK